MSRNQRSHNLRKFPQIYAVSMGVVLVIMRILCILFKSLLSHSQPSSPYRNTNMEISCESAARNSDCICDTYANGCLTCRHDGKSRISNELKEHGYVHEGEPSSATLPGASKDDGKDDEDDMYNYQCNLMDHGMLYLNFTDAIAEGDGDRVIRCWKFLLLHFFADGNKSTKYALEALYLLLQQLCLLSPRQAYCQKWNRTINNHNAKGKNVALDLDLEHDNNYLKEALRKMGPVLTEHSVTRVCRSLKISREVIENLLHECEVMKRSGIHFTANNNKDLVKIVKNLVQHEALIKTKGRRLSNFKYCLASHLQLIKMDELCKWIDKHKYEIIIARKAR